MSFQQGLSGLAAAARNLDVIGNNVANSNTAGFKTSKANFADVIATSLAGGGSSSAGLGVAVAGIDQQFTQGNVSTTNNPLDFAVNGNGFFRLSTNGTVTYTRNGQFKLDKDGFIVNTTGARLQGYPVNGAGQIVNSTPVDLQFSTASVSPKSTANARVVANLDSRKPIISAAFSLTDPSTYTSTTSMSIYDSLGNQHNMTTYYRKSAANTYQVFVAVNGVQVGAGPVGTLNFRTDGTIDTGTTTLPFNLSIPLTSGAVTPLLVALDYTGTTQYGANFAVSNLTQDGYTSGQLTGFNVSSDGKMVGRYSNGQSKDLGQVVLAAFNNPQGLQPLGNNQWAETSASGQPLVGTAGSGTFGVLQSGAVEDSNVDLTAELVNMITAQRIYQANAQTIKTQDQVLQTLVNLR